MKRNIAGYFSKNKLASWPIWKTAVSGMVAFVILLGSATGAVAGYSASVAAQAAADAQAAAEAQAEAQAAAAQAAFEDMVRASWRDVDLSACAIKPVGQVGTEETQMDLSSSQQSIGIDLYTVNSVTGKRTAFTGKDVTVKVTCKSLTEIKDSSNKYSNDACKEGAISTYKLDTNTGSLLIKKINPGEYSISVSCTDSTYIMPSAQKITVKEKVSYKKVAVKAQSQTAATKQEDTNITAGGGGAETTIASPTNATGKGYSLADTKTWEYNGAKYLYYKDGTTRSAYKVETASVTNGDGQTIDVLAKAVYDEAAQKQLDAEAMATAKPAAASAAGATLSGGAMAPLAYRGGAQLIQLTSSAAEGVPSGSDTTPAETPSPTPADTPAPTDAPTDTPTATPEATTTVTPAPTAGPTDAPASTATPAATAAPSAAPSAAASATPTAAPSATAAPAVSTRPAYASEASYELFSASSGSLIDASAVFALPAGITVVTSGSSTNVSGQVNGIDVSYFQGNIDWNAVKASGIDYAIIRCGYRGYSSGTIVKDPKFDTYIKGAKAAGLRVGVYFFSQAVNEQEAVEEASACLNAVSGYGLNYPIYIDIETSGGNGSGRADGLNKAERTAIAVAFCETVRNSGYSAGVYASRAWFNSRLNYATISQYSIWNAYWPSAGISAGPGISCNMWQYTSKGSVPGISSRVDLNVSYMG